MPTTHPDRPETWLPVVGWPNYEISDMGRVRSVRHLTKAGTRGGLVLAPARSSSGRYLHVGLSGPGGRAKTRQIHRLVLEAFAGLPQPGQEGCHGPGGSHDNRWPENLRWGTHAENVADMVRDGTWLAGEHSPRAKLTRTAVLDIRARWLAGEQQQDLAAEYGVSGTTVCAAIRGRTYGLGAVDVPPRLRASAGERSARAKLTWAIVDEARRRAAAGETVAGLAREYGVGWSAMRHAIVGKSWAGAAA